MPIFRPPDLLIKRFSDVVIPMLDSIQMMLEKNANLRQTRDLLLPKLISGEIDVSELDIIRDSTI
jgi:type I restriction enzyme S subunit